MQYDSLPIFSLQSLYLKLESESERKYHREVYQMNIRIRFYGPCSMVYKYNLDRDNFDSRVFKHSIFDYYKNG